MIPGADGYLVAIEPIRTECEGKVFQKRRFTLLGVARPVLELISLNELFTHHLERLWVPTVISDPTNLT